MYKACVVKNRKFVLFSLSNIFLKTNQIEKRKKKAAIVAKLESDSTTTLAAFLKAGSAKGVALKIKKNPQVIFTTYWCVFLREAIWNGETDMCRLLCGLIANQIGSCCDKCFPNCFEDEKRCGGGRSPLQMAVRLAERNPNNKRACIAMTICFRAGKKMSDDLKNSGSVRKVEKWRQEACSKSMLALWAMKSCQTIAKNDKYVLALIARQVFVDNYFNQIKRVKEWK
jgi:hypothetical protein